MRSQSVALSKTLCLCINSKLLAANTTEFQKVESGLRVKSVFIWQVNGDFFKLSKKLFLQTLVEASTWATANFLQNGLAIGYTPHHYKHSNPWCGRTLPHLLNHFLPQLCDFKKAATSNFKDYSLNSLFSTKQTHRFSQSTFP